MKSPLGIIFFTSIWIFSCKKIQPEMSEFNKACDCANEVSADFFIEEKTFANPNWAKYTNTDSILGNKNVRFRAKELNAQYTWYLGSEVLIDSVFERYFGPSALGQTIPITLVVKKTPNKICFPNDDGYDSIVKYFTVTNYPVYDYPNHQVNIGSIEGSYRVKSPHISDSFDVTVDVVTNNLNNTVLNIYNYDGNGTDCLFTITMDDGYNYRQLFLVGGTATLVCDYLRGDILHKMGGDVEMNFRFYYEGHPNYNTKKYIGRKL